MNMKDIAAFRKLDGNTNFSFQTDLFTKPIWGDMGEDVASIILHAGQENWHLSYIRTQNGEPYPLAETVSNLIDSYEKELSDEQLYDYLSMHQLLPDFMIAIQQFSQKEV